MDLYSMIKRENFFDLFFPTVKKYYKEVLNENIDIRFASSFKDCNCTIKPRLSVVTSLYPSRRAKSFFYTEWNIRNSFIKNIMAKLYVCFMTNSGSFFAEYRICLEPRSLFSKSMIIAPNNRTIRVFNYEKNVVGCICKEGFTDKFMKNQIRFRTTHNYDFILPVLSHGERWFTEIILKGHPLARVTNNKKFSFGFSEAIKCIKQIASDSLEYVQSYEYCEILIKKLDKYRVDAVKKKHINTEKNLKNIVDYAFSLIHEFPDIPVPIADSHGDLQTGNIWLDNGNKIWLYDWETADKRSIWYDFLVLKYSLRRTDGWKNMLEKLSIKDIQGYILDSYPSISVIKGFVLLEDLVFYFEDMLELPGTYGNMIFDDFIFRTSCFICN